MDRLIDLVSRADLALAQDGPLETTVDVVPAPIAPGHLDALVGGKAGLALVPVGVVEERAIAPVVVVEVHLASAEPDFASILDIDAGQELAYHKLLLLRVDGGQVAAIEIVAQTFSVVQRQSDVDESVAFVLAKLEPADLAGALFRNCYLEKWRGFFEG